MRSYRNELELSQEAFAWKAGINRTYIASLEAGQRNPSLDLVCRIAKALGVDAADLTEGLQRKRGR